MPLHDNTYQRNKSWCYKDLPTHKKGFFVSTTAVRHPQELKSMLVISLSLLNKSLLSSWSPCACESISLHLSNTLLFGTGLAQHLDFQTLACLCPITNIFFRLPRWRPFLEKFMVLKCLAQLCQNLLALAGGNILAIQMWQWLPACFSGLSVKAQWGAVMLKTTWTRHQSELQHQISKVELPWLYNTSYLQTPQKHNN